MIRQVQHLSRCNYVYGISVWRLKTELILYFWLKSSKNNYIKQRTIYIIVKYFRINSFIFKNYSLRKF